jgi:hypothetical protein
MCDVTSSVPPAAATNCEFTAATWASGSLATTRSQRFSSGQDSKTSQMFLHVQRLVLPNRVEHLDVQCPESFEPGSKYAEKQMLRDANGAYAMLDQECDKSWKSVT